jgi:hypothetical protein
MQVQGKMTQNFISRGGNCFSEPNTVKKHRQWWIHIVHYYCIMYNFTRCKITLQFTLQENCALLGYYAVSSGNFLPKFRAIYWPHLQGEESKTLVRSYHYSLRNNPEEHSSHLLCGGSLKSCIHIVCSNIITLSYNGCRQITDTAVQQ